MKYVIIILSAIVMIACKKETQTAKKSLPEDTLKVTRDSVIKDESNKISIENFPFPKEIKECSCYFARSKADFENEKYIYADNAGTTAYMKIDGKRLTMNLISSSDMENDDILNKEIESGDYKISVKGKKLKSQEVLLFEGTLTVEKPDGTKSTIPIYGECGC